MHTHARGVVVEALQTQLHRTVGFGVRQRVAVGERDGSLAVEARGRQSGVTAMPPTPSFITPYTTGLAPM